MHGYYSLGLRGDALLRNIGLHALQGATIGAAVGAIVTSGTGALANTLWAGGGVSASTAIAAASFYFTFPLASAGLALSIAQIDHGIRNDDPVDAVFGGLGVVFSLGIQAQSLRRLVPVQATTNNIATGPRATTELLDEFVSVGRPRSAQTVSIIGTEKRGQVQLTVD